MIDRVKELSDKNYERIKDIRHLIHMHPEIGFEEFKTSKIIVGELEKLNIEVKSNIAKTGVVGLLRGKHEGKTVMLRADMDGLKLEEKINLPYKSKVPGMMHGCGHDGHVASLLGTAMILSALRNELKGNIKFVFQPAEETEGGAKPMIEEGILENPKVDAVFGGHLWGSIKEGEIHVKHGAMMAAPDTFKFKVIGKGGHGGSPHLTIDPIVITCQIVSTIQTIVSRKNNPLNPLVITCGKIKGGDSHNIIPNEVEVSGTVRTFDEQTRSEVAKLMEDIIKGICISQGATYEFEFEKKFPPLINDYEMTDLAKVSLEKVVGKNNVKELKEATMGAEDFSYYIKEVPGSFFFVGIAEDENNPVIHHNPYFKFDDKNLKILSESLAQVAIDFLNK